MPKEIPIKVKLLVVLGSGHLGPINLTIWEHHTPQMMTGFDMDDPLGIPPEMRTRTQRLLFSMRKRRRLQPRDDYGDQGVRDGDILVLTDVRDDERLYAISQALADHAGIAATAPPAQETRFKAVLRGALQGIPYAGRALEALILGPKRGQ